MPELSVTNHCERSMNKICAFRKDSRTADVVLVVEDEKIPVHRFILAAHSEILRTLLYGDFKESRESEVSIEASKSAFKILLNYFYSGFLKLKDYEVADVVDLLELSRRFDLKDLEEVIVEHLGKTVQPDNVAMVLEMALLLEIKGLEGVCWPIVEMIAEGIFEDELELSEGTILKLLERKPRRVSDIKLFQLLHSTFSEGLREKLLSSIDFSSLTLNQIISIVQPTKAAIVCLI